MPDMLARAARSLSVLEALALEQELRMSRLLIAGEDIMAAEFHLSQLTNMVESMREMMTVVEQLPPRIKVTSNQ